MLQNSQNSLDVLRAHDAVIPCHLSIPRDKRKAKAYSEQYISLYNDGD